MEGMTYFKILRAYIETAPHDDDMRKEMLHLLNVIEKTYKDLKERVERAER